MEQLQTFLRVSNVMRVTGLPKSTIYELAGRGEFPKPVRISRRLSGWLEAEIVAWQQSRIAQRDSREAA
jgi:prophage regulatory protein